MGKFLASSNATLTLLLLALLAQLPHTAALFHRLSPGTTNAGEWAQAAWLAGWGHAYIYALALEGGILLFVVRGRQGWSWVFAGASVLVNVGYYWQVGWGLESITTDMLRAALISLMLPLAIALYSHEIAELDIQQDERQLQPAPVKRERVIARPVAKVQSEVQPEAQLPWEQSQAPLTPAQSEASTPSEAPLMEDGERNSNAHKDASAKERAFALLDSDSDISNNALAEVLGISPGSARTYRSEWRKRQVIPNGVAH